MSYFNFLILVLFYSLAGLVSPSLRAFTLGDSLIGKNLLTDESVDHIWASAHQGTLVVFLSSTCPCSHSHLLPLKELAHTFPQISFLGVHSNVNEEKTMARDYFREQKINFPILSDPEAKIANLFKAVRTPHAFLVNKKGEIIYRGGVSSSADYTKASAHYLKKTLEQYIKGVSLERTETRVLGCQIQRP
jgi:hypothetical protein